MGRQQDSHTPRFHLHQGDALAWLADLAAESVDLVITDPPYESLERHRAIGTTTRLRRSKSSSNAWFTVIKNDALPALFAALYRVLRRNSHCYMFCDATTAFVAKPAGESAGFRFWKPLVWNKQKIGMGYHYRCQYEFILFFEKGKRRLTDLSTPDVLSVPRVFNGYPTEKPAALADIFVRQSSLAGALVLDPFAGSSSTGVAALRQGRSFIGADICDDALTLSHARLSEAGGTNDPQVVPYDPQPSLLSRRS